MFAPLLTVLFIIFVHRLGQCARAPAVLRRMR